MRRPLHPRIIETSPGHIVANLGEAWPAFNTAFADAISLLPPLGSTERAPSTHWIDHVLQAMTPSRSDGPILRGRAFRLLRVDGYLVAHSALALFPDERIPLLLAREVFTAWRNAVARAGEEGMT